MRLILVRHPAPELAPGLCYGASDVPVARASVDAALAAVTAALHADVAAHARIYSSPLQRCTALAAALAAQRGAPPPVLDVRLAEMDFGAWELRAWNDIDRAGVDAWAADLLGYAPGGGETVLQVATRVADFLDSLPHTGDAIIICHAGAMRLLAALHEAGSIGERRDRATIETAALCAASTPHRIDYAGVMVLQF